MIAPSRDAVRAWLPGALLGAERAELPHVVVRVSHLEVDLTEQRVKWLGKPMSVSTHELQLLASLGGEPGPVWTFEDLMQSVWGTSCYGDWSAIYSAVKRLRKKLTQTGASLSIESARGVGFRLVTESRRPKAG